MQSLPTFYGECLAIRLVQRSENDPHICFHIVFYNGVGEWVDEMPNTISCNWLAELSELNNNAVIWLNKHASIHAYGWNIKSFI
jgi:hypothetical protein